MKPHTFLFISVVFRSLPDNVNSDAVCDGTPWATQSCQVHCDSLWGKVPLFNVPWTRGFCLTDKCVCRFNYGDLYRFTTQTCIQMSFWGSLGSRKKIAEKIIKENVDSMNLREQFEVFKKAYEKKYSSLQEEQNRFEIFKENLVVIENLMAEREGNVVFGIGPYTDLTSEEYLAWMGISGMKETDSSESSSLEPRMLESRRSSRSNSWNWWRPRSVPSLGLDPPVPPPSRTNSVPSFCKYESHFFVGKYPEGGPMLDWRVPVQYYPETEPQNLPGKECKACWAFAAADAIAIELARSRCKIVPLSKQALLDCVPDSSCSGGDLEYTLHYIRNHGLPTSEAYPYEATAGECKSHIRAWARIAGYVLVDAESLATYLRYTPIPTNMHAPMEFQHYVSGVFDVPHCSDDPEKLDHSVVIVGHYKDAWIVRSSSSKRWGIQGHALVKKGRCGIGVQSYSISGSYVVKQAPERTTTTTTAAAAATSSAKRKRGRPKKNSKSSFNTN